MIYYRQYKTQTQGGIAGDFLENGIFFSFFGGNVFQEVFSFYFGLRGRERFPSPEFGSRKRPVSKNNLRGNAMKKFFKKAAVISLAGALSVSALSGLVGCGGKDKIRKVPAQSRNAGDTLRRLPDKVYP